MLKRFKAALLAQGDPKEESLLARQQVASGSHQAAVTRRLDSMACLLSPWAVPGTASAAKASQESGHGRAPTARSPWPVTLARRC